MSRFKQFAEQAQAVAKENMNEYKAAIERLKKAEQVKRDYPQRGGIVSADYAAKSARAEADFLEAKEGVRAAKMKMEAGKTELARIKKTLTADIEKAYAADPAQVDRNALELLKTGILTVEEYQRLYNDAAEAGNHTMCRVIGKYALEQAEGKGSIEGSALRAVAYAARTMNGSEYLEAFHAIEDVYSRCTNNPAMIDHWDMLLGETIDNF